MWGDLDGAGDSGTGSINSHSNSNTAKKDNKRVSFNFNGQGLSRNSLRDDTDAHASLTLTAPLTSIPATTSLAQSEPLSPTKLGVPSLNLMSDMAAVGTAPTPVYVTDASTTDTAAANAVAATLEAAMLVKQ